MLELLGIVAVVGLVAIIVIGAIVLSIVKMAQRLERRLTRATNPRSRRPARKQAGRTTGRPPAPSPRPEQPRPSSPAPRFRVPPVFGGTPSMRWAGPGQVLRLHELAIDSPLAFISVDRRPSGEGLDPSEIVASLPASPRGSPTTAPDWPRYARLTPEQRHSYLSWLASGRRALPIDRAWAMLHLMGLERRSLVDGQDLGLVVQEVCRVRELVGSLIARESAPPSAGPPPAEPASRRWSAYLRQSGSLLWTLVAWCPDAFTDRDLRVLGSRQNAWGEEALSSALAWCLRQGGGMLPPWLALHVAEHAPGARRSVVTSRVPDQFAALFETRYTQAHPGGLTLRSAVRPRSLGYRPANDAVRVADASIPDPLGLASQFKGLVEIWNSCIDDLRTMARAGAAPGERPTLAAWSAIPHDLRQTMENPFAAPLATLASTSADESGHAIVTLGQLAAAVAMDLGERTTLTPTMARDLATAIDDAGLGLEPDPRATGLGGALDAPVALLPARVPIDDSDQGRSRYLAACAVLRLGAAVALADGDAGEQELEPIARELERAFALSEGEHERLAALLVLLRARGSDVRAVGKRLLEGLSPQARASVGTLLVAVASADGQVGTDERAMLRTCYRALGLSTSDLDSALASLQAPTPAGATAQAASPHAHAPLRLDHDAIARITQETREVAQLLADAMRVPEEEPAPARAEPPTAPRREGAAPPQGVEAQGSVAPPVRSASAPSAIAPPSDGPDGLPPRFRAFYAALLNAGSMTTDQARSLAREHNLMLAGALDAINDWAFELAQGPLIIEEGDRLVIDADRRRMIDGA